jgi:hypothetical protein
VTVETYRALMDCSIDEVKARIEDGRIAYAFDVSASRATEEHRRELRIWARHLFERVSPSPHPGPLPSDGRGSPNPHPGPLPSDGRGGQNAVTTGLRFVSETEAMRMIVGTTRERLASWEVVKLLQVSHGHLKALIDGGMLRGPRVGHTQYAERASLETFLMRRRIVWFSVFND